MVDREQERLAPGLILCTWHEGCLTSVPDPGPLLGAPPGSPPVAVCEAHWQELLAELPEPARTRLRDLSDARDFAVIHTAEANEPTPLARCEYIPGAHRHQRGEPGEWQRCRTRTPARFVGYPTGAAFCREHMTALGALAVNATRTLWTRPPGWLAQWS